MTEEKESKISPQISRSLISVFTHNPELSTSGILLRLFPKIQTIFPGDPLVLPNVDGIPPEVPRITLQTNDQKIKLGFSLERYNLEINEGNEQGIRTLGEIRNFAIKIIGLVIQTTSPKIGRIAWVVDRYFEVENPGKYLSTHFCKDSFISGALKRPESFELHSHKRFQLSPATKVNSWVRCKTGTKKEREGAQVAVIHQDINTLAEEANDNVFDVEKINSFLVSVEKEFDVIYNLYFD